MPDRNAHNSKTSRFGIVALAASAGGLTAISEVLAPLPADFPVPIVVVQHLAPGFHSRLAEILAKRTMMKVKQAESDELLQKGIVYIAPPANHLLVTTDEKISLTQTELVHFLRPSADLLFESVAASFRERAIAVVLSGTGNDASMGVVAINAVGGVVIAQDSETAEFGGMPQAAFQTGKVDFVLPLADIAPKLIELVNKGVASEPKRTDRA